MIKQLAQVLRQILNYKKEGQWENVQMVIDVTSKQLLGLNPDVIEKLNADALITMFTYNGITDYEKCLTLATLLTEQAEVYEHTGQAEDKIFGLYFKSFELFYTAFKGPRTNNENYLNYAIVCCDKLLDYQLETDQLLRIFTFYNQNQHFAKAENVLYLLLDRNKKEAKDHAINFYNQLLKCDDLTLKKGNLPRDEVVEGLNKLTRSTNKN